MEDSCLQRQPAQTKVATGISIFLLEELGDARLRCAQLKKYVDEAVQLVEKSEHRDHLFEVAAHLLHGIPDTLLRMDKALSAAAMAAAKLDYEEIKEELRPEKIDALEKALEDVRVRRVKRRSKEAKSTDGLTMGRALEAFRTVLLPMLQHETREAMGQVVGDVMVEFARMRAGKRSPLTDKLNRFKPIPDLDETEWVDQVEEAMEVWFTAMKQTLSARSASEDSMKVPEAAAQLEHLASEVEVTGKVAAGKLASLIVQLEGSNVRTASAPMEVATVLRGLSASLLDTSDPKKPPSRLVLASALRRVLAETLEIRALTKNSEDDKRSRFEEGKPADPTENMSPEDAKRWREEHDKNKDQFKSAAKGDPRWIIAKYPGKTSDGKSFKRGDRVLYFPNDKSFLSGDAADAAWKKFEVELTDEQVYEATYGNRTASDSKRSEDEKQSRFEEGKPADPTQHMDKDDALEWKQNTDEHKDNFKAASVKTAAAPVAEQMLEAFKSGAKTKGSQDEVETAAERLCAEVKKAAKMKFDSSLLAKAPTGTFSKISDRVYDLAFEMGSASAVSDKTASAEEAKRSRFEEGKPADPTQQMDKDDALEWKQNTEEHKDNFKSAAHQLRALDWKVRV